jgi:small-conductance mechanosensitive channel
MMTEILTSLDTSITAPALRIILIMALAILGWGGLRILLHRAERLLDKRNIKGERLKHLRTMYQFGINIGSIIILIVAGLMILHEFKVNIAPLLASASIAGLAISLAAQEFIKDYLGGVLILTENQFSVGDVITVGNFSGTVEKITMRATYLREFSGYINLIPNGEIRTLVNQTEKWNRAIVDINMPYDADMSKVLIALRTTCQRAYKDERVKNYYLEEPQHQGYAEFADWAVKVRIMAKTHPGKHWEVANVLRSYALEVFTEQGIKPALPYAS